MSTHTIAVFGEALVDDFITEQVVGGAPFNVARNLAAFGAATLMVTRIGADKNGALMRSEFTRFGMSEAALQIDPQEATGRVVVERSQGAHRFIILPDQAYDYVEAAPALAALAAAQPQVIYFGTLAQRHETSRASLRALLEASPACRYLDLNVREGQVTERIAHESLHLADIVKVNEDELQDLFRWYTHTPPGSVAVGSPAMADACLTLMRTFALQEMIVTLGPRGAIHISAEGSVTAAEAHSAGRAPVHIVDTVGAGDAFSAVFLLGQQQGWPLALTLARANAFAGAICGISGAVPGDLAFYAPWIACWQGAGIAPGETA